jgi:thioredoxin 2
MSDTRHIVCPHCSAVNRIPTDRPSAQALCGGCHRHMFEGQPLEVDEANFERHLRSNDIPVLLDVWAPWCGPCRTMAPSFASAAKELEPGFRLLKLNADNAPSVTARLGVHGIPALFLFRNGKVVGQTAGALNASAIVAWARRQAADGATTSTR